MRSECVRGVSTKTTDAPLPTGWAASPGSVGSAALLDASALLAFLQGETGAEIVEARFAEGPRCAAVNWSEVAQKVRASGADWPLARALLASYGVRVEAGTEADAEWAASRWRRGDGLSLADPSRSR